MIETGAWPPVSIILNFLFIPLNDRTALMLREAIVLLRVISMHKVNVSGKQQTEPALSQNAITIALENTSTLSPHENDTENIFFKTQTN